VRVNAVSPGPTRTEGTNALGEGPAFAVITSISQRAHACACIWDAERLKSLKVCPLRFRHLLGIPAQVEQAQRACERHYAAGCDLSKAR